MASRRKKRTRPADRYADAREFLLRLWKHLWQTERRSVQVLVAGVCILTTFSIGLAFAGAAYISIYPILLWLLAIAVCFGMLHPAGARLKFQFSRTSLALLSLLASAFFLRAVNLNNFPPFFHPDENGMVDFALRQVFNPANPDGTINPFRTGNDSQPVLYSYILRLSLAAAGYSIPGARISSVIAGSLAVLALFVMVNEFAGSGTAWLTAILMAVYNYHIHWSRLALNNIWVTLFLPLTIGLFLAGWRQRWSGGALWAGLCLGLTAYFYAGGYVLIFLMLLLIWQAWGQTEDRLSLSVYTGKMLALALVVASPLLVFAIRFPDMFLDRSRVIAGWTPAVIQDSVGDPHAYWAYFWYQLGHSLGGYNFYPDNGGFYNPHIPFLVGVASILFLVGVGWAVYRKQYFPLTWIALVTLTGGFLVSGPPASSHYIGVIPAICWVVALPLNWLIENKRPFWAYFLLLAIIVFDLYFYFALYPAHISPDLAVPFPTVEPLTK